MNDKPRNRSDFDAEDVLRSHRRFVQRSLLGVAALILLMVIPLMIFVIGS